MYTPEQLEEIRNNHLYDAREHWLMLQATLKEEARLAREALQQAQAARQAAEERLEQAQAARQAAAVQAQAAETRSKQEAARAERLAERLRALGIDDA